MKPKTLLIILSLGMTINLQAQFYDFSVSTDTYNDLVGSTSLNNGMTWDDPNFAVPIGIDFEYFGETIDELFLSEDGLGAFLVTDTSLNTNRVSFLIPYGADIIDRGYDFDDDNAASLSNISYLTEGDPGNRILKLEWNNVGFYSELEIDNISSDFTNIQLWLYEGTNVFEIRIGDNSITQPNLCFDDETGAAVLLIEGYDIVNEMLTGEALTLEGTAPSPMLKVLSDIDEISFLEGVIPSGTVFRFDPNTTSVQNNPELISKISLFPNPMTEELSISFDAREIEIQFITIYNSHGQMIRNAPYQGNRLEVSNLTPGIYLFEIQTDKGVVTKKLMKE